MKLSLTAYLAIALVLSLAGNAWQLYHAGGAAPRCEAKAAKAIVRADQQVRKDETKRDKALDAVTTTTQTDTRKAVTSVREQTRERAETIDRATTGPGCAAPVGLPSLDAAVDQARRAAGN